MARSVVVTITATVYLLVYTLLHALDAGVGWIVFLFLFSPVIMVWLALSILSDHSVHMRELEDGEEWGYADRPRREELGVF